MKRCPKIRTAGRQKSFREEFFNSPLGAPGKTSMAPKVNSLPSRLKPGPWNLSLQHSVNPSQRLENVGEDSMGRRVHL